MFGSWLSFLIVGLGGFFGSMGRYGTGLLIAQFFPRPGFFYGTLTVNVVGCVLIGVAAGLSQGRLDVLPERMRLLAVVGFLGGYTTYSSFGLESFVLFREGRPGAALLYIGATLVLGLAGVGAGFFLTIWARSTPF